MSFFLCCALFLISVVFFWSCVIWSKEFIAVATPLSYDTFRLCPSQGKSRQRYKLRKWLRMNAIALVPGWQMPPVSSHACVDYTILICIFYIDFLTHLWFPLQLFLLIRQHPYPALSSFYPLRPRPMQLPVINPTALSR